MSYLTDEALQLLARMHIADIISDGGAATSEAVTGDDSGGGYVAKAVTLDGTATLGTADVLSIANSPTGFLSMMTKGLWSSSLNNDYLMVSTPDRAIYFYPGVIALGAMQASFSNPPDGAYHHVLISWDTNKVGTAKVLAMYIDDLPVALNRGGTDNGTGYSVPWNGETFWLCASNLDTPSTVGDFSDVILNTQTCIAQSDNTIAEADRRNFLNADGTLANPSVSTAAYGTPSFLLSGDASTYATNQGNGGALTLTGVLTAGSLPVKVGS